MAARSRDPESVFRAPKEPDFRQERARRSYLGLIDAAEALFAARGYDAVGTPEIAQRAGVAVGTFYRYFDDKQQIYLEVARRTLVSAYQQTLEGLSPEKFVGLARHETISSTLALLFEHVLARPSLTRSIREMALRDAAVAELITAFEHVGVSRLTALISALCPPSVVPDPEATAWVLYSSAMQTAYALAGHFGAPPVGPDRARAALTAFIERALFHTIQ